MGPDISWLLRALKEIYWICCIKWKKFYLFISNFEVLASLWKCPYTLYCVLIAQRWFLTAEFVWHFRVVCWNCASARHSPNSNLHGRKAPRRWWSERREWGDTRVLLLCLLFTGKILPLLSPLSSIFLPSKMIKKQHGQHENVQIWQGVFEDLPPPVSVFVIFWPCMVQILHKVWFPV